MKPYLLKILLFCLLLLLPLGRRHIFWAFSPEIANNHSPFSIVAFFAFEILVLALFIGVLLRKIKIYGRFPPVLLGFFLWIGIDYLLTPRGTPYDTYILLKTLEILLIFALFVFVSRGERFFRVLAVGLSISGLIQALIGIGQFVAQKSLKLGVVGETILSPAMSGVAKIQTSSGQTLIRPYGTLDHPNQLAAFLLVACATTLYLFVSAKSKKQQIFFGLAALILTFAEFLTFSRTGIAAILIMFLVYLTFSLKNLGWGRDLKKLSGLILVSIAIPVLVLFPKLMSRATVSDASSIARGTYNQVGLEIIKEHPLFGVGPGNMIFAVADKMGDVQPWQIQPPHNYFIDVACETGIIGLLLFAGFLIYLLTKTVKSRGTFEFSVLVAVIILMFFDHYFYDLPQTQLLLWIILGIITGLVSQETINES